MGYTHYFEQKKAFTTPEWTNITTATNLILKELPSDMICGSDGRGDPIVSKVEIAFNGNAEDDRCHESFVITKAKNPDFNFCKTARKEYDVAVVAVLCIVEHFAPGKLDIGSDGCHAEWAEGLALAQKVIPAAKIPPRVTKEW